MTTILIVDDEPGVRDLLRDAMEIAGYQTEVATNGAEALDLLRRHNADLCIVDINMPTMDGFEFLAKLREHDTQTPVLMLSARDSPVDVAKGLRFGADGLRTQTLQSRGDPASDLGDPSPLERGGR